MMKRRGHLFVLSSPSGAGKSTLIDRAVSALPHLWHCVSVTTRPPRSYEKEGVHYYFLDQDAFHSLIQDEYFLEWAEVYGEYYGTPAETVYRRLEAGDDVIMDLDVQGALQVKRRQPEATLIFILPPSMEELRARLLRRGAEPGDHTQERLEQVEAEMSRRDLYDHVIVNDVLEDASRELVSIIQDHRGTPSRRSLGDPPSRGPAGAEKAP